MNSTQEDLFPFPTNWERKRLPDDDTHEHAETFSQCILVELSPGYYVPEFTRPNEYVDGLDEIGQWRINWDLSKNNVIDQERWVRLFWYRPRALKPNHQMFRPPETSALWNIRSPLFAPNGTVKLGTDVLFESLRQQAIALLQRELKGKFITCSEERAIWEAREDGVYYAESDGDERRVPWDDIDWVDLGVTIQTLSDSGAEDLPDDASAFTTKK